MPIRQPNYPFFDRGDYKIARCFREMLLASLWSSDGMPTRPFATNDYGLPNDDNALMTCCSEGEMANMRQPLHIPRESSGLRDLSLLQERPAFRWAVFNDQHITSSQQSHRNSGSQGGDRPVENPGTRRFWNARRHARTACGGRSAKP